MSTITQSSDFAMAPQKAEDKIALSPQLTATAIDEPNKTNNSLTERPKSADNNLQEQMTNKQLNHEQLEKVAQQLQDFMGEMNRSLQFQVDEESGRDVIKVIDKTNGELIKQYPSEEVLSLVAKLSETAGMLIDQTV
ncbi:MULTISPECIES: flagellar protein FlaG [Pseudoalteromonas]|uniref:Flagellar protein FlaG n=1 Tax=Pseudoalteromonas haloplanktis TaxID=228 RepID=A0ABU1BHC9_PSEHA|nr:MULTISPECIES: flagellar protein FlaG [Pseudoalteromonas]MCF6145489.1 flagellar protein FlaG [Pseudoalteromonas mariniglutinosa NCIMB 1770]MDQ9092997.1 flagellar protein FlaG [Pseudoalteromonas haloplanktis]BDF95027.1 protein FlaG [Pseudoalteromonas sp. KAN5]